MYFLSFKFAKLRKIRDCLKFILWLFEDSFRVHVLWCFAGGFAGWRENFYFFSKKSYAVTSSAFTIFSFFVEIVRKWRKKSGFVTRWKLKLFWKSLKIMKKYSWNSLPVQNFAIPLSTLSAINNGWTPIKQDDPWKHSIQTSSTTVNGFFNYW